MEGKENITDDLLLDYIDGVLSEKEAQIIKEEIAHNDDVKLRFEHLKQMDSQLQHLKLSMPSDIFSAQIMMDLTRSIYEINRRSRLNGLIILLIGLITVIVGAIFISQGLSDVSFNQYLDTTSAGNLIKLPVKEVSFAFDIGIITQGLLFILVILSLLIIDRIVLKPYFKSRRTHLDY